MAVSPKKTTKARKRSRRSHHALQPTAYIKCRNCNSAVMNHNECSCGHYKLKQVVDAS